MKVILLMALTVDGMIARSPEEFPDWTGTEDKRMFKKTTLEAGVLIMGAKTYDTIGRPLPGRRTSSSAATRAVFPVMKTWCSRPKDRARSSKACAVKDTTRLSWPVDRRSIPCLPVMT